MPSVNVFGWWCRRLLLVLSVVLYKCKPVAVWAPDAQLCWWHFIVIEEMLRLHHGLWELILFHGHAVCQIILELIEPGVVRSSQDHTRQVLFAAHLKCRHKFGRAGIVEVSCRHSLCSQLGLYQPQFISVPAALSFYNAHQCLEVFHLLRGCRFVGLVECRHSVFRTFKCASSLMVIFKLAAVPSDDCQ